MADNAITIVGNMTRDPEMKLLNSGQACTKFSVAVTRKDKQGNESVSFFDVTTFGSLAENAMNSLHKGNRVFVSGRLEQSSWETEQGEKRSRIEILADCVGPDLRWNMVNVENNSPRVHQAPKPVMTEEDYAF
jgi:single-strand DNA-binding protein